MSFSDSPHVVCDELARELDAIPSVAGADVLAAHRTPSGRPEVDLLVESTDRGTLPNSVAFAIVQSSLGIADCTAANAVDHKRVVVR
jgi:hypothetical protein